jgi:PAS domain S-box-containing protein
METELKVTVNIDDLFTLLWDKSLLGMILSDSSGKILKVNPLFPKIFDINKDITGENINIIYPEAIKEEAEKQYHYIFNSIEPPSPLLSNFRTLNGNEKFLLTHYHFLKKNGQTMAMLSVIEDITDQKIAANEILCAKEKIEESERLKASFLAKMSHEIRTPMNGIIGFSSMLIDPDLTDEKRKQFVEIITSSSNQLLELIDDIIDLSKIEAHQVEIINKDFYLNNLLNDLYVFFSSTAISKNIHFTILPGLQMTDSKIITDEQKLKNILTNLLSNAFKFTHEGKIEFGYTIQNKEIQFFVNDTGIGINPRNFKTIFEHFRQGDDSNTRQYGGTGLGLPISKSYIELLGGRIWLNSKLNQGSSFYFTVPYHPVQPIIPGQKEDDSTIPDWTGKLILIAEDEEINYIYLSEVLAITNVTLLIARNGLEAVEIVKNKGNTIDLILMDIKMPEMNGFEATKIIKQAYPQLPIIAQTAYAMAGDRDIALAEGCNDYISKPVKKDKLITLLKNYIK